MNSRCVLCKAKESRKIQRIQNYTVKECLICGLQFIEPLISKSEMKQLYQKGYFFGGKERIKGYKNYNKLQPYLVKEAKRKLKFIQKYTNAKKILDVGCGTGIFLDVIRKEGYETYGNDISSFAIEQLKMKKIKYFKGSLTNNILPKKEFGIITAWDVIEHTYFLNETVQIIYQSLKKNGYFFLTTPSTDSIDAKIMKKNWYNYKKIPEHIVILNTKSIKKLLEDNGFKVIKILNWGFVRNLDFILDKLIIYSKLFILVKKMFKLFKVLDLDFFLPLTDCIIVAQKYK